MLGPSRFCWAGEVSSWGLASAASAPFLAIIRGFGDISCKGSPLGNPGEAIDSGVLGGKGIGCLGALGESGTAPGKAPIPRGDIGGEFKEALSEGFRGNGEPSGLSIGLGLSGRPGLIIAGETVPEASLSIPAKEPVLESGDKCRRWASGGAIGIVGRGLAGIESNIPEPSFGVVGLDFGVPLPLFFERLLNSASFIAAISRSLSSSSLVFRRPRSVNVGISLTSKMSS